MARRWWDARARRFSLCFPFHRGTWFFSVQGFRPGQPGQRVRAEKLLGNLVGDGPDGEGAKEEAQNWVSVVHDADTPVHRKGHRREPFGKTGFPSAPGEAWRLRQGLPEERSRQTPAASVAGWATGTSGSEQQIVAARVRSLQKFLGSFPPGALVGNKASAVSETKDGTGNSAKVGFPKGRRVKRECLKRRFPPAVPDLRGFSGRAAE